MSSRSHRRLWVVAGTLLVAHVVLLFVGAVFTHSLQLGDDRSAASTALVESSMSRSFFGGYVAFIAFLVFLVVGMLLAQLLRDGETGGWLASCIAASAIVYVAVTVATGFAAGAAALYNGHHGADVAAAAMVNDIRNFGFILCGGLVGVFALSVAGAARVTGELPRWVSSTGFVVGALSILAIPGARVGLMDLATMLGFVWLVALGVSAIRRGRRTSDTAVLASTVAA